MLTADKKKEFVTSIINLPADELDQFAVQKKLHQLLLCDTTDGKLYKYRGFDSHGYSLKNLEDGTLHCASATSFNDPFDCKIGVTFQSLYEAKYGTEIDLICKILEKFILVVRKEISISDCDKDEQRIIGQLLTRERLMRFITGDYSHIVTEDEAAATLKANAVIILELMQTILEDQNFSPSLGICASMMPKLLDRITNDGMLQLTKNNGDFEDFARANDVFEDADEIDLTMLVAKHINPELADAADDIQKLLNEWDQKIS